MSLTILFWRSTVDGFKFFGLKNDHSVLRAKMAVLIQEEVVVYTFNPSISETEWVSEFKASLIYRVNSRPTRMTL